MAPRSELPPRRTTAPLLERGAQVAAISALVEAALAGNGGFVVIEGSAGIGKTRLYDETRAVASSSGMRVLAGRGGELEGEFAFGVVRQLFEPLLAKVAPDLRGELFTGAAARAERLFDAAPTSANQERVEDSFAILHGLYWLCANLALTEPTLVAVDDVHWADVPSVRWLTYLTRRLEGLPLMVVVATRPPEAESPQPLVVADLIGESRALVIHPEPLGIASIALLAHELHGLQPDQAFCLALQSATAGNPLFVGSVLDAVAREHIDPTAAQAARLREIGAQGVSRAVGRRLARLPPDALALLRAGSVLGDGGELRHAAALAGLEGGRAGKAASNLVKLDLLRRDDPLAFAHPVVRTAIYENLDAVERGAAHHLAAVLVVEAGGVPEYAAAHLLRTARGEDPFTVATLRQAAERSLCGGAADAAISYLSRALEEKSDPKIRADVLVELGLAERRTSGPSSVAHLSEGYELLTDPARRGEVALELGRALWFTDRPQDALAVVRRALDEVDRRRDPDLFERLIAEQITATWWDPDTYPVAERRIAELDVDSLNGGFGSDVLLATMSHYECRRGLNRERAVELARRAIAAGRLPASGAVAFSYAGYAIVIAGLFDEALAIYNDALAAAQKRGDIFHVASMLMWRGRCQTYCGDLAAAISDLREALDLSVEHGVLVSWPYLIGFLAWALLEQGDTAEAARIVALGDLPEQLPSNLHLHFFRLARARLRIEIGSPEPGVKELIDVGESYRRVPMENPALGPWRSWTAVGLRLLGRDAEALSLAREEVALAQRWGAAHAIGAALRVAGLTEGGDQGIRSLGESVTILADSGARVEHARALVDLGAALRRANQRTEARRSLRDGVDLAQSIGAMSLAARANEEIAATGARRRAMPQTGVHALTASERRVAQMAAEEMSNKEIAQALFVTVKTVEVHLSGVYRKLEIGSRGQLRKALVALAPSSSSSAPQPATLFRHMP